MTHFDVVVIGLGVMGSAALRELARRKLSVLGIEQFAVGHDRGSSHGATRIIRLAYFEHPSYVPLVQRAYALWRELEASTGQKLLHVTGVAEMGPPHGELMKGTLASARPHGLPHEVLSATELMRRFPAFRVPADFIAMVQPDGGYLLAEPSVRALLAQAKHTGAQVRERVTVRGLEPRAGGVRIVIDGDAIEADAAIVAAGPWLKSLLPDLPVGLRVTRQVTGWFAPLDPARFAPGLFPVFLMESSHGMHYGFPPVGESGVKVAKHHHRDESVDPNDYNRTISTQDESLIRGVLADHIPAANGPLLEAKTCLYTVAPDGDFILDRLPGFPQVIVTSACSGHGFKFAPAIGEALADLATTSSTDHEIARFSLARFG
jgi:sarcosine oxidase